MSDLSKKNLSFHVAVLLGVYWLVVFAIPFMIADASINPGTLGWCFFGALISYCAYTGLRALRRGSKARFILRIVVPAALFVTASMVVAVIGQL